MRCVASTRSSLPGATADHANFMAQPAEQARSQWPPLLSLPSARLTAQLGPVVLADDPCEAASSAGTPTGPRKYYRARYYDPGMGGSLARTQYRCRREGSKGARRALRPSFVPALRWSARCRPGDPDSERGR